MTTDGTVDDDFTSWDSEPSPAHPHVALLLGGSLLTVVLVCVLPLLVLKSIRPGLPEVLLLAMVVLGAACGLGPFVSSKLQSLRYVAVALAVFDALPLVVVVFLGDGTPERHWTSLLLIPVLLTAATLNRRFYQRQLAVGCLVGLAIMIREAPTVSEGALTSVGYLLFMLVCANLTRQDWKALHVRFEQLKLRSHTDELTGLLNRRGFVAQFPELRRRAMAGGAPLGMVMIDIDYFSRINALHGHAYGDAVLQRMCAVVLRQPLVHDGLVARIGGEELVVVAPHTAAPIAEMIRRAVASADLHPGLTVSMGIADSHPADCSGAEALWRLVNLTDTAMYQAKEAGRDRIVRVAAEPAARTGKPDVDGWPVPGVGPSMNGGTPALHQVPDALDQLPDDVTDDNPIDYRLFGVFCLVFAVIGALAFVIPVAVDPDSPWIPAFLGLLALVTAFGVLAVVQGRRLRTLPATLMFLTFELCTISAVLATANLEHRLMIICVITVPVLIAAHSVRREWLISQYVLVFVGVGLAALGSGDEVDTSWLHRTLSLAVVISTAPAVLFWLRARRGTATARLRMLTATDPLTSVRNRGGLEKAVLGAELPVGAAHVLSVNIDGFKSLNDTLGHVYGDQALVHLANTLSDAVRDHRQRRRAGPAQIAPRGTKTPARRALEPVVARTGGDRFVIVCPSPIDPALVRRVKRAVTMMSIELSVSFGEAAGPVSTSAQLWKLVADADADLVRSKLQR